MRLLLAAIGLYMIWGYSCLAQAQKQKSTTRIKKRAISAPESAFSFLLELEGSSNLRQTTDPEYAATTTAFLSASYKFNNSISTTLRAGVEKKLYDLQESTLANTEVYLKFAPIALAEATSLNLSLVGLLPTNEVDRNDSKYRGATGGSIGLKQNYAILSKTGSASYTFSALKNYHEFDRTITDEPNLSHRIRHIFAFEQELFSVISLELLGRYQTGWTYQNILKTAFLLSQKINFAITKDVAIYISHTNAGNALKANGVDSNIEAYDSSSSEFATGLVAGF